MKRFLLNITLGLALIPLPLLGQMKLKVSTERPTPGQTVVIETDMHEGPNTTISWTKESGEGDFEGITKNQSKVTFRPIKPGDVLIVCEIRTPDGEFRLRSTLSVSGHVPPSSLTPTPTPSDKVVQQLALPRSSPKLERHPLPPGTLAVESIEFVVPSGFMGDAMVENGQTASLSGTSDCHWGNGCYRLEFKPGKLGWAAFAWQRVPDGSSNWGENPGVNLSHNGYRSLRVWAKGQRDGDSLPRIQFKSGGNVAPQFSTTNRASYTTAGPFVQLTDKYEEYCLGLHGQDLTNVVSPFTIAVSHANNPKDKAVVALIDDVYFSPEPCPTR